MKDLKQIAVMARLEFGVMFDHVDPGGVIWIFNSSLTNSSVRYEMIDYLNNSDDVKRVSNLLDLPTALKKFNNLCDIVGVMNIADATPSEECEAIIKAYGKWELAK